MEELDNLKETDSYFLKLCQDVIKTLDLIDEMIETNGERNSKIDSLLSDYYHILENSDLHEEGYSRVAKEIKNSRELRRHVRNEYEIQLIFMKFRDRLLYKESRKFFIDELMKRITELNRPYKNRVLTDSDLESLLAYTSESEKKKDVAKRKRRVKDSALNEKIKEMLNQGYSQTKIAQELGKTQPYISLKIKKMKEEENA